MSQIALLPIDNRPVCCSLARMIINQTKEHQLYLPDVCHLGDLKKYADIEFLFSWLENLKNIDILVISLDTIAYGGLISSRRNSDNYEVILNRVNRLAEILKKMNAKIFAFSSIMRISNNNINDEEKIYWREWGKKIFEYSYMLHKNGTVEIEIPNNILNDYLYTRKRNFEINKYYIELKKQGIFDTLVFSKDDCAEFGINVQEAQELEKLSKETENIYIKTGADEIPLTLMSRALNKEKNIKICPIYTNPDSVNKIAQYEDITVKKSVESQIELAGGIVSNEKNCDMVLFVNNFKDIQGELVMNILVPLFEGELKLPDKPYLIADIVNANGGDNNFVQKLLSKDLKDFYGYAAWNTAGNTLGSVISGALTYYCAKERNVTGFKELQTVRFLDDWGYQANIRQEICNDNKNLQNIVLKSKMKKYEYIISNKFGIKKEIKYYFPWNRFFEIGIF